MFRFSKRLLAAWLFSCSAASVFALEPIARIEPNDPSLVASGGFGRALAVEGDTMIVGSPLESDVVFGGGAAYVFERVGGVWSQSARLVSSAPGFNRLFGWSVAVSGDVAVIGEPHFDLAGSGIGSAFVFRRIGGVWTQEARLLPSDSTLDDAFGTGVAVDGDTLVVGASGGIEGFVGRAYGFSWDGSTWSETQTLTASDAAPDDNFGHVLALAQNRLFVGSRVGGGAVFVFERAAGVWVETQKLTVPTGTPAENFGASLAADGNRVVIGAPVAENGFPTSGAGAIYVFENDGTRWIGQAKLTAPTLVVDENVGSSVAIRGSLVSAGGRRTGIVHLFERVAPDWVYLDFLTGTEFGLGGAIAMDVRTIYATGDSSIYVYGAPDPIPALSSWSLTIMSVLLLIAATLCLRKRALQHPLAAL